ncbi:SDR family NAD(P)-dependent oxidoreductase [Paenalcaligenes hominis]|uniref:SDR family NAD(P)-dependent oxidoreductase n=1 Tax=Paenalcaligenes hominis TaxID=643674 RepID=UPI003525B9C3
MVKKVAVIGFSFRLPQQTNQKNYWDKLLAGLDLVTHVAPDRWSFDTYLHPSKQNPGTSYTMAAGSLGDISQFDAQFFGISPREAELMDPQQRVLLHLAWEAIEHAGIAPSALRGRDVGVYVGLSSSDYAYRMADDIQAVDSSTATGNTASIAANRLSYALDLRGPSMSLDTACSSSLVAFHQACLSIRSGETSMALAGGISLHLHPYGFVGFSKASMLSPTGRCQVFDASGDGYVRSEGGGLFLLKDYDQAIADGDRILAVVVNSGVNTDGHKQGITVPNHLSQAQLIQRTMNAVGLNADDLHYVEAHGTGTAIGDPIETRALGIALGQDRAQPLPIGSVKSNMGHLETASGAAGLIKLLYAFKHRQVPATIGIKELNPHIDFEDLNLEVNQSPLSLPVDQTLRMSINSFGFGGSNAHIILESAPPTCEPQPVVTTQPLPLLLSAKSAESLHSYANELADFIENEGHTNLYDVAYQLYKRRELHPQRTVLWAQTPAQALDQLRAFSQKQANWAPVVAQPLTKGDQPVFVFSGNGSQWEGMGRALLEHPVFLKAIQSIDTHFAKYSTLSLERTLRDTEKTGQYAHTDVAQPALFAFQVGLVALFEHYGVRPAAVIGHSVGEVAAAWACGALSLEQAVQVIFERSRLQETTKGQGQMTAVNVSADQMLALIAEHQLHHQISLAGANSSTGCTIAGPSAALDQFEPQLKAQGIRFKRLDLDYAFHSPAMDPIRTELLQRLADLKPQASRIPMYSVVKGKVIDGQTLDATYWWDNIREPVLFEPAIQSLVADQFDLYIEIGPHPVLRNYVQQACRDADLTAQTLMLCQRHKEQLEKVQQRIVEVKLLAPTPDFDAAFPCVGQFVDLPHYAWELESYWHPVTPEAYDLIHRHKLHPLLGYAQPQQDHAWENQLDTLLYPYLGEHVVGDAVLLPGAAFLEIALAAAKEHYQSHHIALENLTISAPLVLQEQPAKKVRVQIDETDGRLVLRSKTLAQDESWTEHAQARVVQAANHHWQHSDPLHLPERAADFSGAEHYALTQQVGLNYGPHFSAIQQGWHLDEQTILSELQGDDYVAQDLAQYLLHPGLVDSCFQSIIHLLVDHPLFGKGVAFVPVQLEHAYVRTDLGRIRYARTQFLRLNPHSLCANFDFYNADGIHLAHLSEVRFRTARLQSAEPIELSYLDYQLSPRPLTHTQAHFKTDALAQHLQHSFDVIASSANYERVATEIDPLLNSLADLYSKEAVWQYHQQHPINRAALAQLQHEQPERHAMLALMLLRLEQTEEVAWHNDELQITAPELNPNDVWFELSRDYSDAFALFLVVARVGMHLHEALVGQHQLHTLRGATVSQPKLIEASLGAHQPLALQHQLALHLQQQSQQLPAGQRLRIVEIAQQQPWFAEQALHELDANQCDYTFWATHNDALEKAQSLQHEYPALHCDVLQAEALPTAGFDVVLISGDFDSIQQADLALLAAEHALVDDGTLMVFSLHASYWHSFIHLDQPQQGLLPQAYWQQRLAHSYFNVQHTLELDENAPSAYCLLATKTASATPTETTTEATAAQQWYVLADTPTGVALAEQLTQHLGAEHVICRTQWDLDALQPDQTIIYLGGLQNESAPALDVQQQRCAQLAQLVQQHPYQNQALWVVCTNATPYAVAPLSAQPSRLSQLNDASTWGFVRTLMNESDRLQVKAVDFAWLDSTEAIEQTAHWLHDELIAQSKEQEVVYSATGQRYAPRLQLVEAPNANKNTDHQSVRLEFSYPGQLRNLRWQQVSLPALQDQDIKVRIHATGLNFRDVMYTLGMLSDEAVEHGFAGASLGLEFAGVVESVGTGVTDYKPGDRVVGFGSHSFGTYSISSSSAMAPLPDFIQYEAAATIPSTFFTVYYALKHLAHLEAGERVLIHGAAGGVGIAAIQLATYLGAEIYATASSPEKRDFLRLMGVKHIYDSRSLAFADDILHDTEGEGVDVVLNSLAGEAVNRNLQVLRPFGRFLELGKRDFYQNSRIGLRPFRNNISYFGIDADQLMQAKPALTQRLFREVMSLMADGQLAPLPYQAFDANHIVDAFRYMQQARQIGKIVVTYEQPLRHVHAPALTNTLQLRADATYVITGGLGGFGLRTAQWLVEKGAQHLLLLSRRGASSEEATQALADFKAQGINAQALACDVTQATDVAAAFAYAAAHLPPIKGIIHAATVIDDALIMNLSEEQIRRVLEPKIKGAWHLHEHSLQLAEPLDLFVVYSSATTLFGNLGQSNYVAANHWLEALMGLRLQQGLAATNVRWGAIDDVGFLARHNQIKDALKDRMGGAALPAALALEALEAMLVHQRSHLGVMELDWNALDRFLPTASSPKFSAMAHLASESEHDGQRENWSELLATLSPEALQEHVTQIIKSEVSEILRLPVPRIDAQQSIYDMGLDSLLGVELVLALENRFGVRIPVMSLSESPTIERLSLKLIDLLQGTHTESGLSDNIQQIVAQHNIDVSAEAIAEAAQQLESDLQQPQSRLLH